MGESHICGNSANIGDEECSLTAALQLLYCRMLSSQPEFFEEDVGFTEYPLAGNPLTHSPTHSPTHMTHTSSHWGDAQGESDETGASSLFSRVAVCSPQTLSASSEQNVAPPTTTVPDLDPPITCQRFFEVVKNFDAKMILRSRKVALDTLKLLSCAYALAWRDACELPRFTQSNRGASSRAMTSVLRAEGVNSGSNTMLSTSQPLFGVPSASTSLHKPEEGIVRLMDKCIGCLLVYANESAALRNVVASNTALLKLLCFVCVEARKLEVASHRSVVRDLQSEFSNFTSYWGSFAATQSLLETLQECYLVEFLLDAALPPTVCSGKYDGIAKTLFQKKGRLVSDLFTGRVGCDSVIQEIPLRGLAALISMVSFVEPKARVRVLDRMVEEGLVSLLRDEILKAVCESAHVLTPTRGSRCVLSPSQEDMNKSTDVKPCFGASQESSMPHLVYCLHVLKWLTAPELEEEPCTASFSKKTVRCTTWASHLDNVRDICVFLFHFIVHVPRVSRPYEGQVLACIGQIAGFGVTTYNVVVEALNFVISSNCCCDMGAKRESCVAPLLPLLADLVKLRELCEANEDYTKRWFAWLDNSLIPHVFDAPLPLCAEGSATGNEGAMIGTKRTRKKADTNQEGFYLMRPLRRDEVVSLSPFFGFATRMALESPQCSSAEPFFRKIVLLARHVMASYMRRPNLVFGQASTCYRTVFPLLNKSPAALPFASTGLSRDLWEATNVFDDNFSYSSSPTYSSPAQLAGKKRHCTEYQSLASPASFATSDTASEDFFVASPERFSLFVAPSSSLALTVAGRKPPDDPPPDVTTASSWRCRLRLHSPFSTTGG